FRPGDARIRTGPSRKWDAFVAHPDRARGSARAICSGSPRKVSRGRPLCWTEACTRSTAMDAFLNDIRIALRLLPPRPGGAAAVLASLALAIGANTALFSILDAALLRPLPFPQPDRLVLIHEATPSFPEMSVSYPDYVDWRQRTRSFVDVGAPRGRDVNLTGSGSPQRVRAHPDSASHLRPLVGRTFEESEDRVGGAPVMVLSEGLARRLFGSPVSALGRTFIVDGTSATVVGVMPSSFRIEGRPELWLPLAPAMVGSIAVR